MRKLAFTDSLTVMTMVGFALAQPLYDLLGRNTAFFIFHRSEPTDVVLLVVVLSLLLPAMVAGLTWLLPGRRWTVNGVFTLLAALTLTPVLAKVPFLTPLPAIVLALTGAIALAWCRLRFQSVRWFLLALSPALVVFPALFLTRPPIAALLAADEEPPVHQVAVKNPVPVVMIVFDEFPLSSLLDANRQIDAIRNPHFAALSRDAHWFRNATAVHGHTTHAIPALLTGKRTLDSQSPRWQDHPDNLFTLLAGSHELRVMEWLSLCPASLNVCKQKQSLDRRMGLLLADLLLVEAHLLLPREWARVLPPVDADWARFGRTNLTFRDRSHKFRRFLRSVSRPVDRPGLHFLHLTVPHTPFCFLPSGKGYGRDDLIVDLGRQKNNMTEEDAVHRHQRHLLQVGYADNLLGQVVERLKKQGMYDDCLLVVTADHGCSFHPGKRYRDIAPETRADILRVPLLVKTPGQKQGAVSERNVQHVDVLPTIAHVLGVNLPWVAEGQSVLDETRPAPTNKCFIDRGKRWEFGPTLDDDWGMLGRKLELFGSGDWLRLYQQGRYGSLVGEPVAARPSKTASTLGGRIDDADSFASISLASSFIPARIQGRVKTAGGSERAVPLAIAVNGTVRAVTQAVVGPGREAPWAVMVAEESFRDGNNAVELYEIDADRGALHLVTSTGKKGTEVRFRLEGEQLIGSDGRSVPLRKNEMIGWLDVVCAEARCVAFGGWAVDTERSRLPERIVILADGEQFHSGEPSVNRPDIVRQYRNARYRWSGFNFSIPRERFVGREGAQFRFFALSTDGTASELRYPDWYQRRGQRPLHR